MALTPWPSSLWIDSASQAATILHYGLEIRQFASGTGRGPGTGGYGAAEQMRACVSRVGTLAVAPSLEAVPLGQVGCELTTRRIQVEDPERRGPYPVRLHFADESWQCIETNALRQPPVSASEACWLYVVAEPLSGHKNAPSQ